jgi:hypothetical protein
MSRISEHFTHVTPVSDCPWCKLRVVAQQRPKRSVA